MKLIPVIPVDRQEQVNENAFSTYVVYWKFENPTSLLNLV